MLTVKAVAAAASITKTGSREVGSLLHSIDFVDSRVATAQKALDPETSTLFVSSPGVLILASKIRAALEREREDGGV